MKRKPETIEKMIGGTVRAKMAKEELDVIFKDPLNPLHLAKDIEFAQKYNVARHTVYKIRKDLKIPPRSKRLLAVLKAMDCSEKTIKDLSEELNVKYQNLYKVMSDNNIAYKKD